MMIGKTMGTPIAYLFTDPDGWGILDVVVVMLLFFGIPAILTGWVLQAIIVAVKGRRKHRAKDGA